MRWHEITPERPEAQLGALGSLCTSGTGVCPAFGCQLLLWVPPYPQVPCCPQHPVEAGSRSPRSPTFSSRHLWPLRGTVGPRMARPGAGGAAGLPLTAGLGGCGVETVPADTLAASCHFSAHKSIVPELPIPPCWLLGGCGAVSSHMQPERG